VPYDDPFTMVEELSTGAAGSNGAGTAVIGTPDDMVKAITTLYDTVGGFGCILGFAHDWANREATWRSWELFARYVIPEVNGHLRALRRSADYVSANKAELMAGASAAIMQKVMQNERAAEAMVVTMQQLAAREQSRRERR